MSIRNDARKASTAHLQDMFWVVTRFLQSRLCFDSDLDERSQRWRRIKFDGPERPKLM